MNTTQQKKRAEICSLWEEQSQIPFNTYGSRTDTKGSSDLASFLEKIERELGGTNERVVINGGHYIPNIGNLDSLGENPRKTWDMACSAARRLNKGGIDARVSLMINDLPLTPEERQEVDYRIPLVFANVAESYGVKVLNTSTDPERPYSEKRCSNKLSRMEEHKKWQIYPEKIKEHCIGAIIFYLRDLLKQGVKQSLWITPKCSHKNMLAALRLYQKYEGGVSNRCYFETSNCFK